MRNPLSQLPRYAFICFALLFCAIGCEKKNEGVLQIKLPADVISRSHDSEGSAQEVVAFLKNIGGSSIGIAEISTSCHCTSIGMLETTQLAPGQEAKLVLSATPPEFGTQHVTISVKYDATARRTAEAELVLTECAINVPPTPKL
ncbi:MAG: DUF1573 domain-containing protein [Planctomycetales bacterium]|nr:DUF1573 domain-containing protein [Planctomycetales bacterium]